MEDVYIIGRLGTISAKVTSKSKWKSIPMSHNFFTGDLDQAVCGGIEELTDYTLVVKGKKSGKVLKRELSAKKSSHFKVDGGKSSFVEKDEAEAPPTKKAKKNVFQVTDVEQSITIESKKEKKKNKKVDKPAINMNVFTKLAEKVEEVEKKVVAGSDDVKHPVKKQVINSPKPVEEKENIPEKPVEVAEQVKPKMKEKQQPAKKKGKKGKERIVAELDPALAVDIAEMGEWKDLFVCDEIIKALAEKGFKSPTPIQKLTLPASLNGNMDIVGAAETGSGKTLAFGIPIIQGILGDRRYEKTPAEQVGEEPEVDGDDINGFQASKSKAVNVVDDVEMDFDIEEEMTPVYKKGDKLRALVLTPTRELAMQVHSHLVVAVEHTGVRVAVVVGGLSVEK